VVNEPSTASGQETNHAYSITPGTHN